MAEIALKVGSVSANPEQYQDGDIVAAFNSRMIRCTHAQNICHVKQAGGGRNAHRSDAHVARDWFENTHQYRFERVSRTEIKRITLADMSEVTINDTPQLIDGKMQHMDVERYIQRRLAHEGHKIFGTDGAEVWYGGRTDVSNAKLDLVWAAIESKTAFLEANHTKWPAGGRDLMTMLFLPVNDFSDTDSESYVASEYDLTDPDNPVVVRKRKRFINWRSIVTAQQEANVDNKSLPVDLRDIVNRVNPNLIVQVKPDV